MEDAGTSEEDDDIDSQDSNTPIDHGHLARNCSIKMTTPLSYDDGGFDNCQLYGHEQGLLDELVQPAATLLSRPTALCRKFTFIGTCVRYLVVQNPIIFRDNARSHTAASVPDLLPRW